MPSIDVLANTREAQRNVKDLSKAFDAVADAADDAARDGERGGDRMERSLRDLVKEAGKAEKAVADIGDGAATADREVSDLGDSGERSMRRLGQQGEEIGNELRQNLGETFSSFKGDLADLPQIAQDTLGGLAGAGALGGIAGLAVTAAGAAGLGLITAEMQKQQEQAEQLKQRMGDIYRGAAEEGRAYLDTAQIIAEQNDLIFNPDRAGEWKQIQKDANELGLDRSVVIAANAGDLAALGEVEAAIAGRRERFAREEAEAQGRGNKGISEEVKLTNDLANRWETKGTVAAEAQRNAQIATEETSKRLREEVEAAREATRQVDEFGNELYTLPSGKQIVVSAHTGQASTDVGKFKGDVASIPSEHVTYVRVRPDVTSMDRAMASLQARANSIGAINIGTTARVGKVVY